MSAVVDWVKSNLASVIFFVVMVAALVALPIVASHLNHGVQERVQRRADSLKELRRLEKTQITIPGSAQSESGLINERLLSRYREVIESGRRDAEAVRQAALEHNRKGRQVIMPSLFPSPPPEQREVLPQRFHGRLVAAYDDLLARIRAGSPPSAEEMADHIEVQRARFLGSTLQKDVNDPLDATEASRLEDELIKQRMLKYAEKADKVAVYASPASLAPPVWEQAHQPSLEELFEWQWEYWIAEDVLLALSDANGPDGFVQNNPVKHILEVTVLDPGYTSGGGSSSDSAGSGGGSPGFARPSSPGGRGGGGGPPAAPPNPAQEVKPDFTRSLTGRASNPLYDVRDVQVRLVAETARLPQVLDALARRNFITVLDLQVVPADQYAAARNGFFYGREPVSEVTLLLETVWLREWTSQYMPDPVREALGVPLAPQPSS